MPHDLLPCPFCGGEAELDTQRGYRALSSGRLGNACAAYCTKCEADMTICLEDVPDWSVEEAAQYVTERWNTRTPSKGDLDGRLKRLEIEAADLGYDLVPERQHPDSPNSHNAA